MAAPAPRDETGHDVTVTVNGNEIATTTTSFTYAPQTSESVMNDSPRPSTTYTYWYAEGSLEWDGSQMAPETAFMNANGSPVEKANITLRIQATEATYRCTDVTIQGLDKEFGTDSHSSSTLDWKADTVQRD